MCEAVHKRHKMRCGKISSTLKKEIPTHVLVKTESGTHFRLTAITNGISSATTILNVFIVNMIGLEERQVWKVNKKTSNRANKLRVEIRWKKTWWVPVYKWKAATALASVNSCNAELMVTKLPANGWMMYNIGGNSINVFVLFVRPFCRFGFYCT